MSLPINNNGFPDFLYNDIEQLTKQLSDEIKKIDELLKQEPTKFSSRLEKVEFKRNLFELINKRNAYAFKISLISHNYNK